MSEIENKRLKAFEARFGQPHLYFACHIAFLPAFTPHLLDSMWKTFQKDIYGLSMDIPWIAQADLRLSNLCKEVGMKLYEIDRNIQKRLQILLSENKSFGMSRVVEISEFSLQYAQSQLDSNDTDTRDFAKLLQFNALAYLSPDKSAKLLAKNFADTLKVQQSEVHRNQELVRLERIVESLSETFIQSNRKSIVLYAQGLGDLAREQPEKASKLISQAINLAKKYERFTVDFSVPEEILGSVIESKAEVVPSFGRSRGIEVTFIALLTFSILVSYVLLSWSISSATGALPIAVGIVVLLIRYLNEPRPSEETRIQLIQFNVLAFLFSGTVGLILGLIIEPSLGIAATAGLFCLILSFKYRHYAFYAFIIYIPFSGTVTYMLGGNSLLQLAKDAFYVPALIGVVQMCRRKRLSILLPETIQVPLVLVLAIVILNILLVNLPQEIEAAGRESPLMMGFLGLKILLGYLPVITCVYYLLRTSEDLYFLLRIQALLVLVACFLGFTQYLMLKIGICAGTEGIGAQGVDLFKASLQARCFVGGALLYSPSQGQIRLPGTFVAPWQWGWFLISSAFFSFSTAFNDRSPFWRLIGIISLVTVFVMSVVSGQQIALFLVPLVVAGLCIMTGQVANLKRLIPISIILGLILVGLLSLNPELMQERIDSFQARWNASPPHTFVMQQFSDVREAQNGILGNGVARATNGARLFGDVRLLETYHPKLLYELGPLGLLFVMLLYTALTVATFKAYRRTKDKNLRGYAASMWVFVLFISFFPYYYPLDVDPVSVYYWLAVGIALKVPILDKQERELAPFGGEVSTSIEAE